MLIRSVHRMVLWTTVGIFLALVAVYRVPTWPTRASTGQLVHCTHLDSPIMPSAARRELDARRRATPAERAALPTGPCAQELAGIASGDRLREARRDWMRKTGLILAVGLGLMFALYWVARVSSFSRRWRR